MEVMSDKEVTADLKSANLHLANRATKELKPC